MFKVGDKIVVKSSNEYIDNAWHIASGRLDTNKVYTVYSIDECSGFITIVYNCVVVRRSVSRTSWSPLRFKLYQKKRTLIKKVV